jgi:alpha-L-arabinofuranosidase
MATLSSDQKTLYLAVVNRSVSEIIRTPIEISGWKPTAGTEAQVYELNGKDYVAANPFGSSDNVNIQTKTIPADVYPLVYKFPAHSITIFELRGSK